MYSNWIDLPFHSWFNILTISQNKLFSLNSHSFILIKIPVYFRFYIEYLLINSNRIFDYNIRCHFRLHISLLKLNCFVITIKIHRYFNKLFAQTSHNFSRTIVVTMVYFRRNYGAFFWIFHARFVPIFVQRCDAMHQSFSRSTSYDLYNICMFT